MFISRAWQRLRLVIAACLGGLIAFGAAAKGSKRQVMLSPGSLTFSSQTVGTTSAPQIVSLSNTGNLIVTINLISVTGTNSADFAQTSNCGTSLTVGASCTISVTFTPTAAGPRAASLSVSDNATGSPQKVALTGTATSNGVPTVTLTPTSLAFGSQAIGTSSPPQPATFTNTGTVTVSITSIAVIGTNSGDFTESNTCGTSLAVGASCTISVTFTPTAAGPRAASLSVSDNASGSPQAVGLAGTGTSAGTMIQNTFFGFNMRASHWPPTDTNGTLLPIKAVRLWNTGTGWFALETAAGSYNWATLDNLTSLAAAEGLDVEFTFGGTPSWAGNGSPASPPNDVNPDGTGTDANWTQFVTDLATRYKGKIQFYELWNEQNSTVSWTGTEAQSVRMAQDAYTTIKGIDPSAFVLTPSQGGGTAEASGLTSYLQAGGGAYADIIAFHGRSAGSLNANPDGVADVINALQPVVSNPANGVVGKPLWNTEGGWRPNEVTDVNAQAAYVARQYLIQASMGVGRFYWYGWDNQNGWGTLYVNGPTIAATAYTQVATWLVGSTLPTQCAQGSDGNWTCQITEANGTSALAIWNPSGNVSYTPASNYTRYRDLLGNVVTIIGSVTIGPEPILLEAI